MYFEFVRKSPGYKLTLWWGKKILHIADEGVSIHEGSCSLYIGTNSHPFGKFYFFRVPYTTKLNLGR